MVKVAVVVDSLSKLLLWRSPSAVCNFLHQLFSSSTGTGISEFIIVGHIWLAHICSVQRKLGLCGGKEYLYLRHLCTMIKSGLAA